MMTALLAFVLGGCVCTVVVLWGVKIYNDIRTQMFLMKVSNDEVVYLRGKVAAQEAALKQHEEMQDMMFEMIGLQIRKIEQELASLKKEDVA